MKRGREQCTEYSLAITTKDWNDEITDMMWKRFYNQPVSTVKMAKLPHDVEALYSQQQPTTDFENTQKETLSRLLTEFRQEHEHRRITFLGLLIKYILPGVRDLQRYLVNLVWKQQRMELSALCQFFRRRTIVNVSCIWCLRLDHTSIPLNHDTCHVRRLTWVDDLI